MWHMHTCETKLFRGSRRSQQLEARKRISLIIPKIIPSGENLQCDLQRN